MKVNISRVGAGAFALLLSAGFLVSTGCSSSKVLEQRPYIPAPGETDSSLAVEPTAPGAQIKNAQVPVEAPAQPIDVNKPVISDNPSPVTSPTPTGPVQLTKNQPSNPSLQSVYTVQRGDSLWKIGHKFGMSASELASYNGIPETKALVVGQTVKIPVSAKSTGKGHVLNTVAAEAGTEALPALPNVPAAKETAAPAAAKEAPAVNPYPPFVPKKTTPIYSHNKGEKKVAKHSKSAAKYGKAVKTGKAEVSESSEKAESAVAGKETSYTVQKGDFWARIAKKFHVSVADLTAANNKKSSDRLRAGQKLTIPGKKAGKAAKAGKETKEAKEETDSLVNDVDVDTATAEKAEAPAKGKKGKKGAKVEKSETDAEETATPVETTPSPAPKGDKVGAAPAVDKTAGADLDADAVKTRNVEVTEDCTIEQFAAKQGVKPEEVRKHNPEIGAEGKLKKGDIITIPE